MTLTVRCHGQTLLFSCVPGLCGAEGQELWAFGGHHPREQSLWAGGHQQLLAQGPAWRLGHAPAEWGKL